MKRIYVIALNLGYWLLLALLMAFLFIASQISALNGPTAFNLTVLLGGYILFPSIISFYGSYFFIFRLYIQKSARTKLLISLSSLLLVSSLIAIINIYNLATAPGALLEITLVSFFMNGFNALVGFILQSFISWFRDLKEKEELNKKTKLLELEMVKLKLDPHFLFNTINNIDVLIENDPKRASEYIIKLSSILRFYLYKSSNTLIHLSDEIKYINEYVELQKIRTSNANFIQLTIEGDTNQKEIAPMILIPFIENAFKHSSNKKESNIVIQILIQNNLINFLCRNKINEAEHTKTGIGHQLVETRLKLIYGNNYNLDINISEGNYIVNLRIPL